MSEYAQDINTELYKYTKPIYVTEPSGSDQLFIPLKLNLNSSNFNFDLARSDGLDFRLCEASNGTGVLYMWVAYWDSTDRKATLYFKLPALYADETRTYYAFWGYDGDNGISYLGSLTGDDASTPAFLFGDEFSGISLDSNKWPVSAGDNYISDSRLYLNTDAWIQSDVVLGGTTSTWLNNEYLLPGAGGLYGNHQHTGNCYLGYNGDLIYTSGDLIDGDITSYNTYLYVSRFGGCGIGIDLGSVKSDIKKVRFYFYNYPENFNGDLYWNVPGSYNTSVTLYKSETNVAGEQTLLQYFGPSELESLVPIRKAQDYVWYFDLEFDAPGVDFRYLHMYGSIEFTTSVTYYFSEIEVYADEYTTITSPGKFIVEEGIVGIGSPTSTTYAAHRYRFYGGDNVLGINYFWEGNNDRSHDAISAGSYATYNGTNKGLEISSYHQNYFGYFEGTDRVYQGMANRNTYPDYDDSWERKVHRNTEVSYFRIYGEDDASANGVAVDWVIAREFDPDKEPIVDLTNLWIDYEYVGHQQLDFAEYQSDITNTDFYHSSDMGGDPYRMSDDITNSPANIFISDTGVTQGSITIDFGRGQTTITDFEYIHYNSEDSVQFYNAVKLSDLDSDVWDRDYWQTTTTSGWAAIEFPTTKDISCLSLTAVPGSSNRMPNNFRFYGSNSNPRYSGWDDKVLLYSGTARDSEDEQVFYFSTGLTFYKYYILEVLDTHGGNVAIQEWKMYERLEYTGRKAISQLRLHPVTFGAGEYYFPKEIELLASNDGFTWTTLISRTGTPTPFTDYVYGRWSRYSFENLNSYYIYKLNCYDNWNAPADIIQLAEWEMVELVSEMYNYRILAGTSNNINNIWADPYANTTSGVVYIANEVFNTVENDKLIQSTTVSGSISDFNVKF